MKYFTTLFVALALVSVTGISAADEHPTTQTQTASGSVFIGHPVTAVAGGVSEHTGPDGDFSGFDGQWVHLDQVATGSEPVTLTFTSENPLADLDIWFYDADLNFLDFTDCAAQGAETPETCLAPAGAAFAVVDGFTGINVDFELTYTYKIA